jgi:RsiW-degrading membrane proteinase PrsW (M82 family)
VAGLHLVVGLLEHPGFLMTYAVVQAGAMLLLIRFLDLYEREPLAVVALVALWGATGAAMIAAGANDGLVKILDAEAAVVFGNAIFPPVIEEGAKGLALVAVFVLSHWAAGHLGVFEFHGLTDGLVYGVAVGLGFAFTEDFFYFADQARQRGFDAGLAVFIERRDFFGPAVLHHALFSGAFGAALGLATWFWARGWTARLGLPVLGLAVATLMHSVNNGLLEVRLVQRFGVDATAEWIRAGRPENDVPQTVVDDASVSGAAEAPRVLLQLLDWAYIGLFVLAVWFWLAYQRSVLDSELRDEAANGLIDQEEREIVPRYWRRSRLYWTLLWNGDIDEWTRVRRLHSELVDLAFLKRLLRRQGGGDSTRVTRCRRRIAELRRDRSDRGDRVRHG